MKLLMTIVLISVLAFLIVQQSSAVDENAATRYLLAIANMEPEVVNAHQQFKDCKSPNDLDMLSGQAKEMLMAPRNEAMLNALKWGAKCKLCCYNPDDKDSPDQIPKEKLRGLYRFSMALALNAEKNQKPDQALEILLAVFQLGQHQELQGSMLDGLIGMTIRSDALDLIEGVLNRNPGQARHNMVKTFLKQLPTPAVNLKAMVKWEKRFLINGLKKAASNPAIWKEMCIYRPDAVSSESAKVLEVFDPENDSAAREFIASGEFDRCLSEVASHMDSWITLDQQDPDFKKKNASLALLLKNNPLAILCVPNINKVYDQQGKLQEHINSMLR